MPLRWDLLRHGLAERDHQGGDAARSLTPGGVRTIRELGAGLAARGWRPERVVSSPLRRAVETAELLLVAAGVHTPVETSADLEPDRDPEDIVAALTTRQTESRHWLLVGHQPLMGRLVGYLTGASRDVAPGELIPVRFDGPPGRRRGHIAPD